MEIKQIPIKIAIIDTGMHKKYLSKNNQVNGYALKIKNGKMTKNYNYYDSNGHGTAVLCILDKLVQGTQITNIKIDKSYSEKYGLDTWLCYAFEYILEKENYDIINLSIGFSMCYCITRLKSLCQSLQKKSIIISAYNNNGVLSYQAIFDCVIGIDNNDYINKNAYIYQDSIVNIIAGNKRWILPSYCKNYQNVTGNSFLVPEFSAKICKWLIDGTQKENIIETLKKNSNIESHISINAQKNLMYMNKSDILLKKAIVLPFNKEVHILARYERLLNFEIVAYYDSYHSGKIGESIKKLINCDNDKKISSLNDILWESDNFDTVILSHVKLLSLSTNKNIRLDILSKCLKFKKNLYFFDEDSITEEISLSEWSNNFSNQGIWLKYPKKDIKIRQEWGGKLYNISCPVLCVASTDSSQGKLTVQVALREFISKKGFNVCNFGTEPTSELLGFEGMYTLGYGASIDYKGWENIIAINYSIYDIFNEKVPELIITGTQSRTVIPEIAAFKSYPIKQLEFLLGCAPDGYILCVGTNDSFKEIKRTIVFLENLFPSKVLGLCLNDVNINYKVKPLWKLFKYIKNRIIYRKKTYYLSHSSSLNKMGKDCIRYYSK